MSTKNLAEWLLQLQSQHDKEIELGLDRVGQVAARLDLTQPKVPVVTVAGTNGKGSTVAGLEAIYLAAGYRVGAFTSPILLKHNEYIRIQGQEVADEAFCHAFERIERAREGVSLTFFEFNTLAAFLIFADAELDVWLLEVGLGGRLDAVNLLSADVAVITSIAIDHAERLGGTRELIAQEKAGILRPFKPVVCGDREPPAVLVRLAEDWQSPFYQQGQQFDYQVNDGDWSWQGAGQHYECLPCPKLALENMACVLMTIELLQPVLRVGEESIKHALQKVSLPGRFQVVTEPITTIFDVAHNPAAAEFLVKRLRQMNWLGKTQAVFSMLKEKDMVNTLLIMKPYIDHWYIAELPTERTINRRQLLENFRAADISKFTLHSSIKQAYQHALQATSSEDRLLVFGSFYTVKEIMGIMKR